MTRNNSSATLRPGTSWRARWSPLGALTALLLVLSVAAPLPSAAQEAPSTVVSFTFDDGTSTQPVAADILAEHRMRGTFYIVSGAVGTPGYVDHHELRQLARAGHEIGGHTVHHPDLVSTRPNEIRRQVCHDRNNLAERGYRVTSFAYPYGNRSRTAEAAAEACGYNSARALSDLRSPGACSGCAPAETIPARDPYEVRTPDMIGPSWTLQELQRSVLLAERSGGGWVPFVLHQVCDGCGEMSISPALLDEFAEWLAQRESRGTAVRTVDQVVGGPVRPPVDPPPADSAGELTNPSLELAGPASDPRGWTPSAWGRNEATWARTRDAHTGRWAYRVDVTGHVDGDAKLMPALDLGDTAPAISAGNRYAVSTWYKASAPTELALYYRDRTGRWKYWASSPSFAATDEWQRASWTSPPAPDEATGLSFGLALFSDGSVTTDDYALEVAPDPTICDRLGLWEPLRRVCR